MKSLLAILFFLHVSMYSQERVEVFFDFDKHELTSDASQRLLNYLKGKNVQVSKIYGYCDWKGSNAYNDTLSLRRVAQVRSFLQSLNIPILENYEQRGFGEDFKQSAVQAENRKVIVEFQSVDPPAADSKSLTESIKTMKPGDKIRLKNINFHNNSAVIVTRSKPALYELLCVMEENPKMKIEIHGHICCQLQSDINDVSTARARAIYNFLIRNKIDRKRLSFKGFGIKQPIYPIPEKNDFEADENRRVEILIVEN